MRTLGIIPARGGSKGVPGKNIKPLAGKPLLAYTLEAARDSQLTRTIVSTDSEQIAEVARGMGGDVPFLRPEELATDSAKAIPVLQHALRAEEAAGDASYDAIMMLQPTTPFRSAADINESLEILANSEADSVISVVDVEATHPARMKYLEGDRLLDPDFCEAYENQPRQELQPMYIRNGAIYLTRRRVLLANSLKGQDCRAQVQDKMVSVNIDTEHDFAYAEWVYERYLKEK
ncbi:MAG TPA: N-acylneuraminate cytidylyltransferase [Cytophagales bacterium]|nr:N-acylneuraminate cytidylyltransferase [Cytophagales bacterium]